MKEEAISELRLLARRAALWASGGPDILEGKVELVLTFHPVSTLPADL